MRLTHRDEGDIRIYRAEVLFTASLMAYKHDINIFGEEDIKADLIKKLQAEFKNKLYPDLDKIASIASDLADWLKYNSASEINQDDLTIVARHSAQLKDLISKLVNTCNDISAIEVPKNV